MAGTYSSVTWGYSSVSNVTMGMALSDIYKYVPYVAYQPICTKFCQNPSNRATAVVRPLGTHTV